MYLKSLICSIIFCISFANFVCAKEITIKHKELTLNGNLELAANKSLEDGVILITHGGLMHNRMELYVYLQKLLKEHGYNTLAINLSLSIDNRHGLYDCKATHRHQFTDAVDEIGAWVGWLKEQGVKQVVLFGHSRGGAETAFFAAEHDDPVIKFVVLLAPDTQETNDAAVYKRQHKKALKPVLEKAQQLVRQGKGKTVMLHTDFLRCADTSVTAENFVSYYGPDPRIDTAYMIPKIRKPTLVVIAGDDGIIVNNEEFVPLDKLGHVRVETIEGAGHFFRDLYADDAVDVIKAFISGVNN